MPAPLLYPKDRRSKFITGHPRNVFKSGVRFNFNRGKKCGRTKEGRIYNLDDYHQISDEDDDSDVDQYSKKVNRGYIKLFKKNKNTSKPNQLLVCIKCSASYTKRSNIEDHIRTHRGEKPFDCKYCH